MNKENSMCKENIEIVSNRPCRTLMQMSHRMVKTMQRRVRMLNDLRREITLMYPSFSRWSYFEDCCLINKAYLVYINQYKTFVSIPLERREKRTSIYRLSRRSYIHTYTEGQPFTTTVMTGSNTNKVSHKNITM